jgi:hypothetical protein
VGGVIQLASGVQLLPFGKHHIPLRVRLHLFSGHTTNTFASNPSTSWYYNDERSRLSHELPSVWFHRDYQSQEHILFLNQIVPCSSSVKSRPLPSAIRSLISQILASPTYPFRINCSKVGSTSIVIPFA